jgi:ABC-type polysaccharide/polyol phosphate export permease
MQTGRAWHDLVDSVRRWQMWGFIGLQDVKLRYRRSVLGPFWITLTMGITIITVGLVYSKIFNTDIRVYLPYFGLGFMIWSYISGVATDGCNVFISESGYIRQTPVTLMTYIFKHVWKNVIIFLHNFVIYAFIVAYFEMELRLSNLLALVGFALIVFNSIWVSTVLAILCARYRDIPPVVQSLVGVLFFVTPILWDRSGVGSHLAYLDWNPAFHMIQIFRGPLLGTPVGLNSWAFVVGMGIVGSIVAFFFMSRYQSRVAYWV